MSRRTTVSEGDGLRLDLHLGPDLASYVRGMAAEAGVSTTEAVRECIRIRMLGGKPLAHPDARPETRIEARARAEAMTTPELRAATEVALAAVEACTEPGEKKRLQIEHIRLASVLGPRVRAARGAAKVPNDRDETERQLAELGISAEGAVPNPFARK